MPIRLSIRPTRTRLDGTLPREIHRSRRRSPVSLRVHDPAADQCSSLGLAFSPEPFSTRSVGDHEADVIVCTHTGLHWHKALDGDRHVINAGVIGRPANDGQTNVWYTLVKVNGRNVNVEFVPVVYDHLRLAEEMRGQRLPEEFVETILTGWWTTCLEVLPPKERAAGRL